MMATDTHCSMSYDSDGTDSARNALILEYQDYVQALAAKLVGRLGLSAEKYEDCLSAGYMGLIEAAARYEPGGGAQFKSFAYWRIRGAIIDDLRQNSSLSPAAYRYLRALNAYDDARYQQQADSGKEITESDRLARTLEFASQGALAYRLSIYNSADCIEIADESLDPEQRTLERERRELFRSVLHQLPDKERIIIEQYYFEEKSFVQIAQENEGFSKSWVSRLHSRALKRLNKMLAGDHP